MELRCCCYFECSCFLFVAGFFALSPKSAAGAGGPWEWSSEAPRVPAPAPKPRGEGRRWLERMNTTSTIPELRAGVAMRRHGLSKLGGNSQQRGLLTVPH